MPADIQKARDLFLHAVGKLPSSEWTSYVHEACGDDADLERQVGQLLKAHRDSGSFLERPAAAFDSTGALTATRDYSTGQPGSEGTGAIIGPYKLLQQIGEGGMGAVFMAEQTELIHRRVAIKIIKTGMDSKQVIARFEAERQALAMMDHVNIARVFDAGTTASGRPYFVMELVHGVPITKYCDDNHLTPRERLELFVPVCQAIQHAHQKGIIHRDIKPSNVMITLYDGKPVPKVIDFGVAKATEQKLTERTLFTQYGTIVGTLEYMSPEQAEMSALGVDTRSDIYSLGVLLYELLAGSTPLSHKRIREAAYGEILRMIKEEEPPKPSTRLSDSGEALASISAQRHTEPGKLAKLMRGELDWIVMKALEKDRNRRYESVGSFAADVQRFLNDEPVQACPPSAWYKFRKFARRNKAALATASTIALAVLISVSVLATSTVLVVRALRSETDAKDQLANNLDREWRESYFQRIALAHRELSRDNLGAALKLLDDCPVELRGWEWRYLMRLCRVEPLVIRDKTGIHGISFSGDGERLASAGGDGAVKVWNSRTGMLVKTIPAHPGFASSVAFHPDGNHLVSVGADKLVKVWDLTTEPARRVFERPCDTVHMFGTAYAAAFNPRDPDQVAAGTQGMVRIWNWRTEKPVHTFPAQGNHRISLTFSRDGRRLASGNWRGSVFLWDAESEGEPLRMFRETDHAVAALAFSADGGRVATASFARRVNVWDTTTGKRLHSLPQSGLVLGVAYSPDDRLIVSVGEDKIVHVWDAASGRELLDLRGHTGVCGCVAFSPDGLRLASASADGTIRLWDATPLRGDEYQEAATFPEHGTEVWSVAVSPHGKKIASSAFGPPVLIWDAKTRHVSARFSDYDNVVFCVAWDRDGRRIALAGANGDQFSVKVKVVDAESEQDDFALPAGSEYFAVAFSPDGKYLVTGNGNRLVQVWDANNGQPIHTLGAHKGVIRGVVFSPDSDHKYLASASSDGEVKLWDATRLGEKEKSQEPLRTFTAHSPGVGLNVAFSPDGKRLATGGKEKTVKIWDVETAHLLQTLRGHIGDVSTVAFSPDGRYVASGGEDSTVKVWDSRTGELLRSFRGHVGLVSTMAFLDGRTLITGSRDHKIKFWDLTQLDEAPDR
jgi:WD40 repeat protein/serine/threonine protein kinase